jgi:acyl carrier protein
VNKTDVIARLQVIFDRVFMDEVVVTPELTAADVPEWDSLSHVSLVLAVERDFGVRFGVGEVEATKSVGEFADLIIKRVG